MPLTKSGKKILKNMIAKYGKEKGERIFYAMINEKRKGTEKWHKKNPKYNKKIKDLTS